MLSETIKTVLNVQKTKDLRHSEIKNKTLNVILERIKSSAKNGRTFIVYQIPSFTIGHLPYDVNDVETYVINQIKNENFYVKKFNNNVILISWNISDVKTMQRKKAKKNYTPVDINELTPLMSYRT